MSLLKAYFSPQKEAEEWNRLDLPIPEATAWNIWNNLLNHMVSGQLRCFSFHQLDPFDARVFNKLPKLHGRVGGVDEMRGLSLVLIANVCKRLTMLW